MSQYDNLELYKDLQACESGLLQMINYNFLKIDSTFGLVVKGVVSDFPLENDLGDVYIRESGVYEKSYTLEIWDGVKFLSVPFRYGYHFFIQDRNDFYFYDGVDLVSFASKYGDVTGPSSSLNNSIAKFDGETGKMITDSDVIIDEDDNIISNSGIYADSISSKSFSSNIFVAEIDSGKMTLGGSISILGLDFEDAEISSIETGITSDGIVYFTVINRSNSRIKFLNGGNILTGREAFFLYPNGSTTFLYDSQNNTFEIIDSLEGGRSILIVENETERDTIPDEYRVDGLVVYEKSGQTTTQLQGGISNLDWYDFGSGGGAGGGSLTFSPLSDYSTYTPAMEVINNGAKGLLMDAPNVGVVTSFIVPANYDSSKNDLFVNVPFVCQRGSLSCSFVADYLHKGNGNDNPTYEAENVDVSTLADPVGTYRMVKIPITLFAVLANGLVVLRLRARPSTLLWDAEYIILRDGAFISLEKK